MPLLYGSVNGRSALQPPTDIVRRLQQWDPRLGLIHLDGPSPCWAVTYAWADDDRRREYVKRGELPEDACWDIVAKLPLDCPVEEAPAFCATQMRRHSSDEVKKLVEGVQRYNAQQADENLKPVTDQALNEIELLGARAFDHTNVKLAVTRREGKGKRR